jgi:hypothetical protein
MKVLIDQPFGIGDILFLSPIVKLMEAEDIIWPIVDQYYWIKDYLLIDNLTFIKQSEFNKQLYLDYNQIPFQTAHIMFPESRDCMEAKYKLFDIDLDIWKSLSFNRNYKKELELKKLLNINENDKFIFINNNFASKEYNYKIDIKLDTDLKIVYQQYIDEYTLLDWCGVLEQASEIHTVSTSLFFVIQSLNLSKKIHLYPRKPIDKDLSPIKSLLSDKWICH